MGIIAAHRQCYIVSWLEEIQIIRFSKKFQAKLTHTRRYKNRKIDLMLFPMREIAALICLNFMATLTSQFSPLRLSCDGRFFYRSDFLLGTIAQDFLPGQSPRLFTAINLLRGKKSAKSCPISVYSHPRFFTSGIFSCFDSGVGKKRKRNFHPTKV